MDDPSVRVQVSREGGSGPRWARSGKELFYGTETQIFSVTFAADKNFQPNKPTLLFEDKRDWAGYDVGRDDRFVFARDADVVAGSAHINVVLNWFEELKAKAR
jgi:hypothetical protein